MLSRKSLVAAVSVVLFLGACIPAAAQSLDELLPQIVTYKLGQSRKAMESVQQLVVQAARNPQQRADMGKKLAALLSNPEATFECKDFVCRQLYVIGTPAEVPALDKLLGDEQLSHMGRYVLERMEEPAAGAALRDALATTKGRLLIGVVNSVGNRRDAAAIPTLKQMLAGDDPALAAAAASALGNIGGPESLAALAAAQAKATGELKNVVIDGYLKCADELLASGKKAEAAAIYQELYAKDQPARIRMAALRGLVAAEPLKTAAVLLEMVKSNDAAAQAVACGYVARQMPGEEVTKTFVAAMDGLSAGAQVLLLDALGARGDATAKPAVLAAAKSQDEAVCVSAIKAIGMLGNSSDVGMLSAAAAKGGRSGDAARDALARLRGADVDAAIVSAMNNASADVRVELIKALAARGAAAAVPSLLDVAAKDESEAARSAALNAVGSLATEKDYPTLVQRVVAAKTDAERDAAGKAVAALAARMNNKDPSSEAVIAAMGNAPAPAKVALVGVLARIGGDKALAAVRAAQKDVDGAVQEAGARAITEWSDAAAIPDMVTIAKSDNERQRTLALRGLGRVISAPNTKLPAADALGLYQQMIDLCKRPEEKRLVLAGVAEIKDAKALDMATAFLADDALRNEAATATIKIAKAIGASKPQAKAALQKVIDANVNDALKKQAQDALTRGR